MCNCHTHDSTVSFQCCTPSSSQPFHVLWLALLKVFIALLFPFFSGFHAALNHFHTYVFPTGARIGTLAFPSRSTWDSLFFFLHFACHSLSFHPSVFYLNLSQDDARTAHLLASPPSPSTPSETSEAPNLSQNSSVPSPSLYPSLKPLRSSSLWAAVFLILPQST